MDLIDIHCHILPGVDDGSKSMGKVLQCYGLHSKMLSVLSLSHHIINLDDTIFTSPV